MEGHAEVATKNGSSPTGAYLNGTLAYQLTDPRTAALFAPLWDAATGNWTVLPNAKVWFNENALTQGVNGSVIPSTPADASFGSLTVGYGCGADPNLIGPELGFGFGMTSILPAGEKFLIMKTAWGGKSLAGDFRPPTSVANPDPFCQGASCPNVVGHFYEVMVNDIHRMLAPGAVAQMFPDLAGLTPVLAGFGWSQGWNDGCSENDTAAYEQNFVNLVRDLRAEFGMPALPFSTSVAGFNGFDGAEATRRPPGYWPDFAPGPKVSTTCAPFARACLRLDIVLSQLAAANATRHPELGGHVVAMETRQFWRDPQYSPDPNEGYHYYHNVIASPPAPRATHAFSPCPALPKRSARARALQAETYYLSGLAMAQGMAMAMSAA
jgi:hypothetical protein